MIRGIIALFTSGILLKPMVLLGIIGCICLHYTVDEDKIADCFFNQNLYLICLLISLIYTCIFCRVYYTGGRRVNWKSTISGTLHNFLTLILTLVLCHVISFSIDMRPETLPTQTEVVKNDK